MRSPTTLLLTMIASLLLVAACDDQSEEASSCRYYIQQDLDNQDYDSVLERLNDETCQDTYPDDEYLVDRASAYLGKAGFTFTDILSAAIEEDSDGDALTAFTSAIAELENDDSIEFLEKAEIDYTAYLNETCNNISDKTTSQEGICLVQGVLSLSKTAIALDFLSGGEDLEDSETLDFSACALYYSIAGATDNVCSDFTVTSSPVTFTVPDTGTAKDYNNVTITEMASTSNYEYFLQETTLNQIVFTDGFCTVDFTQTDSATEDIDSITPTSETSYVCPSENETDESVNDFVVTALNDAINNIESLAETFVASDDDVDDIQEAIDEFKEEILPGSSTTDIDFTIDDIIDYLNTLDD